MSGGGSVVTGAQALRAALADLSPAARRVFLWAADRAEVAGGSLRLACAVADGLGVGMPEARRAVVASFSVAEASEAVGGSVAGARRALRELRAAGSLVRVMQGTGGFPCVYVFLPIGRGADGGSERDCEV